MKNYKTITTSKYTFQIPELWEVTDFDKEKYELGLKTQDGKNFIFFNLSTFYETLSCDKEFGFDRIRINILSKPINYTDETYSGNIDILNEINLETILASIELIIQNMMQESSAN